MWASGARLKSGQQEMMAGGVRGSRLWVRFSLVRKCLGESARVLKIWPDGNKAGEVWSIALSEDGQYLAGTSFDGRINVWDNLANGIKIRDFETKGSFGMSIDLVCCSSEGGRSHD